jgi:uncharacterized membrane protein (GlpM family)
MIFLIKVILSALIIAGASELSKKSNLWASIFISLPLISILTLSWVYFEQRNIEQVRSLSSGILWAVIPSLSFFILLSSALKFGFGYSVSLIASCIGTSVVYAGWMRLIEKFGLGPFI